MKRILIFIIMLVSLLSSSFALDNSTIDVQVNYKFENNYVDSTGNIINATGSSTTFVTSKNSTFGSYAVDFELSSNAYIDTNTDFTYDATTGFTIMAMIKPESNPATDMKLFRHTGTDTVDLTFNGGTTPRLIVYTTGGNSDTTGNTTISIGSWQCVAMTVKNGEQKVYLDGNLVISTTDTIATPNPTGDMFIGSNQLANAAFFDGSMDDFTIVNEYLTANDINDFCSNSITYLEDIFIINTNTQNYYNSKNISIDVNTSALTNISYYINNNDIINNNSLVAYYQSENNANDRLGTYNGTLSGGTTYTLFNSSYGYAWNFDGINSKVVVGDIGINGDVSVSIWVYTGDDAQGSAGVISSGDATTASYFQIDQNGGRWRLRSNVDRYFSDNIPLNEWTNLAFTVNSIDGLVTYINGVQYNSFSSPTSFIVDNLKFGINRGDSSYFTGLVDDVMIYDRTLNSTEIYGLYSTSPYNNVCEDCNTTTINLYNLDEGSNDLNLVTPQLLQTESFIIDTITPTINNNILSEYNTYDFNLNSTCSDTNINYCYIIINSQNITLPNNLNSTLNGNLSYTIYSGDLAGNTNTDSGFTLVNPFINFYFNDSINGDLLSDYLINVGSLEYETNNTLIQIPLYDIGLGSADFIFIKEGYVTETFNYNLTNSSDINDTNEVTPVTLTIKVYDVDTLTQLTFDITIDNGSTIQTFTNQTNFYKLYNETPTGDLSLYIESEGYSPAYFYTTLNSDTSITYTAYLINSSTTTSHIFTVQDSATEEALQNVLIEIQEIINSTYTTIAQKVTASNGLSYFNLDATKEYKVILTKNGYVSATASTIPSITTYTVKLTQSTTAFSYIDDISYSFSPSGTILKDNETYLMSAFISGSGLSLTSFELVFSNGSVIYSNTNTNPTGTTFSYSLALPYEINNTGITATLTYIKDGVTTELVKEYQIISITNTSFIANMENFGSDTSEDSIILKWLVMMGVIVIIIVGGTFMGTQTINLAIIPALSFFAFIGWLSWTYSLLLIFISIVFFIGGRR